MIEVKLNNRIINCATNWEELTLKQYLSFDEVRTSELYDGNDPIRLLKIAEILCNVESGDLDDLPRDEFMKIINNALFNEIPELNKALSQSIMIDGVEMVLSRDFNNLKTSEWIAIEQVKQFSKNSIELVGKTLAILIRPKDENGDIQKFTSLSTDDRYKKILNVRAFDVIGLYNFFLIGQQN